MLSSGYLQIPEPDPLASFIAPGFLNLGKLFLWASIFSSVK